MKKIVSLILALTLSFCLPITVFADTGGVQTITTTVSASVPTWTMNIPADTSIPEGSTQRFIGRISFSDIDIDITEAIVCSASATPLTHSGDGTSTLNYWISATVFKDSVGQDIILLGQLPDYYAFRGDTQETCYFDLYANIRWEDWLEASRTAPGVYTSTVTYSSSLVSLV